ncbi:Inhibitor of growth protein 3 [Emericellopsis cladophorae]|uniref:Chromatin modification-related protein n=1 Tax=Emericellopsis cladophorae TaxID=2686198 RepID=A0A9P9XX02_9HYPO|nr:Inhibitor of growth protein 3 [Emericellopsis cladophorae]KAI6779118.1 Inhibitor of growth protein 3 [Emericellopsis cladophorae]
MPRDDLSIDFVKRMPPAEAVDPGVILDDWINRVQNLPEEIRFCHDEIADRDRQYNEQIRIIEDRDAKIQKHIKAHGSHEPNPKEEGLRAQIREAYERADKIQLEKIKLVQNSALIMDKHIKTLDYQIKQLYDRSEHGFSNPDELPSLIRPSAANKTATFRPMPTGGNIAPGPAAAAATAPPNGAASPALNRLPGHANVRTTQTQQQLQQHASSAPATPAASMILNRQQREGSTGPATKRGVRVSSGLGNVPVASSGLARHSSLGPGTPKGAPAGGQGGASRAGSVGPKPNSAKTTAGSGSRRGTPIGVVRKKAASKSSLSRVKKASNRNSPASTADSDLSDAVSGSDVDDGEHRSRGTPAGDGKDADGDDAVLDADEDEDDGNDDRKYCLCNNVSHGDMVACDNDDCPYEWFHWSCVGLKSEPNGTWYCPVCSEKFRKGR